jgi:peptidoglycan hydrolase CwlO-like protein
MTSEPRRDIHDRLLLHATMAEDSIQRRQRAMAEYTLAHYEAAREIENLRARVADLQSRLKSGQ